MCIFQHFKLFPIQWNMQKRSYLSVLREWFMEAIALQSMVFFQFWLITRHLINFCEISIKCGCMVRVKVQPQTWLDHQFGQGQRRSPINWETSSSVFSWRYKTIGDEFLRGTTISCHCSLDKTKKSPDETNKTIPITLPPPEQQTVGEVAYSLSLYFLFVLLLSRLRELTLDESLCSLSSKQYGSWTTAEFT